MHVYVYVAAAASKHRNHATPLLFRNEPYKLLHHTGHPCTCLFEPHRDIAKTKAQISFAVTAKLISAFVFATRIVQFLFYLNPKFQASSSFLSLYRPVFVGPGRKPRRPVFSRRGSFIPHVQLFSSGDWLTLCLGRFEVQGLALAAHSLACAVYPDILDHHPLPLGDLEHVDGDALIHRPGIGFLCLHFE